MSHLYVMQNHVGLIKIGQSYEPEKRRREVEKSDECTVVIVAIFDGRGHEEEEVHRLLRHHRITGEWFEGNDKAIVAIAKKAKLPKYVEWPFRFEPAVAAEWVVRVEALRDQQRRLKDFNKTMRRLKSASDGSVSLDADIWDVLHPFREVGMGFLPDSDDAAIALHADDEGHWRYDELVPRYTRDVNAALLTWPAENCPKRWVGTAIECCVEGLYELRKTWGKVPISASGKPRFHGPAWNRPPSHARDRLLQNKADPGSSPG